MTPYCKIKLEADKLVSKLGLGPAIYLIEFFTNGLLRDHSRNAAIDYIQRKLPKAEIESGLRQNIISDFDLDKVSSDANLRPRLFAVK